MNKDINSGENLSAEDEHLLHRASEILFNKDMQLFNSLDDDADEIPDISGFDRRMYKKFDEMYKDGRKQYKKTMFLRTAAALAAVLIMTFVFYPPLMGKVHAFFFKLFSLTSINTDTYTELREEVTNQYIEEFEGYYYPKYIPDEFEIIDKNNIESAGFIFYSNKSDGIDITYSFSNLNVPQHLDTEGFHEEEIFINNRKGKLFTKDSAFNAIVFQNEEYKFIIYGNIDVNILKKIAQNIRK